MVRAILDGRKTETRRVIKFPPNKFTGEIPKADEIEVYKNTVFDKNVSFSIKPFYCMDIKKPYNVSDYLYVRETWSPMYPDEKSNDVVGYMYRADDGMSVAEYDKRYPNGKDYQWPGKWKPSIHMPKEAARIFLRVTDVKVERLQDITEEGVIEEGAEKLIACSNERTIYYPDGGMEPCYNTNVCGKCSYIYKSYPELFGELVWNETIKPKDRDKFGWEANPFVFVIEFEKINLSEVKENVSK